MSKKIIIFSEKLQNKSFGISINKSCLKTIEGYCVTKNRFLTRVFKISDIQI